MNKSTNDSLSKIFLSRHRPVIWLFFVGLTLYLQTLSFGFSPLDDNSLYLDNLKWFMDPGNIPSIFFVHIAGFYRPILFLTFSIDSWIGAGSPVIYHSTNLLFHLVCAILLFHFLQRLKISRLMAFCSSLLFISHPVNVHAVAWIPGRNDIILTILTLGSFLMFQNYLEKSQKRFLWFHAILYLFALLTKENAVIIPILIIFYNHSVEQKSEIKLPKSIFAMWSMITVTWFVFQRMLVNEYTITDISNLSGRMLQFFKAWIINSGKLILPVNQSILSTSSDTSALPFILVILVFIFLILYLGIANKKLFYFGLVWYSLFLFIPTLWSSIDKIGEYYEHRLYLPLIGLFIMLSGISLRKISVQYTKSIIISIFIVILCLFYIKTDKRSLFYSDMLTFAETCVKESPDHARSYKLLGTVQSDLGYYSEAIQNLTKSIDMNPVDEDAYYNRASSLFLSGNFLDAIDDYNRAIQIKPIYTQAYNNRGIIYGHLGEFDKADADFNTVLSLDPTNEEAYNNKGLNHYRAKHISEALESFKKAIELNDELEFPFNNRGQIYLEENQLDLAIQDFNRAIEINPMYISPYIGRAIIYRKIKLYDLAQQDIDFIKENQPDFPLDSLINQSVENH